MGIFNSDRVSSLGEKTLISRVCKAFDSVCPPSPYGSGDDCALTERDSLQKHLYTTVDSLIYGKHFDSSTSAILAGEKLLKRNISDIASMGAYPVNAVIAAVISGDVSVSWLEEFAVGVKNVAEKFNTKIIGGDFADAGIDKFFSMSLTLLGTSEYEPLLRNKADVGDAIYCTGKLGYSFESKRHLTFTPRVAEGRFLAKYNTKGLARITSCTDISDGLASDIDNILSPTTKAVLDNIPVFEYNGSSSIEHALCDGEDYELLFSVSGNEQALADFENAYENEFNCKLYRMGVVEKKEPSCESSLWLNFNSTPKPFSALGFKHFV